jgi:hypothetical protein
VHARSVAALPSSAAETGACFDAFCRAFIKIHVINREEYEKNVSFTVELGEPRVIIVGEGWQSLQSL